jgi:hypothetical protein
MSTILLIVLFLGLTAVYFVVRPGPQPHPAPATSTK